jgi:hypothetical protein
MPIDPVTGGLIAAGISAAGAGTNAAMSGRMNRKQREWSEKMYGRQYQDNIALWNMQNAYNTPQKQMQRFIDAGLSPHLIYGKGTSGQAGAVNTPDVQDVQYRTPEWGNAMSQGVTSFFDSFMNTEIKQAQYDNLKADKINKLKQARLLDAQTDSTIAGTDSTIAGTERTRYDLQFDQELRNFHAEAVRESVRKMQVDRRFQLHENERRWIMTSSSVKEAAERILNHRLGRAKTREEIKAIRARAFDLRQSGLLKQLEKQLFKDGVTKSDPWYARILARYILGNVKQVASNIDYNVGRTGEYPLLYDSNIVPNKKR